MVTVMVGKTGQVVNVGKNSDYGYIILREKILESKKGYINEKVRTTTFRGRIEVLLSLKWKEGQEVPGRIFVSESLIPSRDYEEKKAGPGGITCKKDGQVIYRKTWYAMNGDGADELIAHNNFDEIREHQQKIIRQELDGSQA